MQTASINLDFQPELIRRFDVSGPRYTSYPPADRFRADFPVADYERALAERGNAPLSLYVHIPFCETLCYYCGCNKIPTRNHSRSAPYLDQVEQEMRAVAARLAQRSAAVQLHWGGGTPTFLDDAEAQRLMEFTREHFDLSAGGEFSIEIDPRKVGARRVEHLARLGFNRMSVGVQDFDPAVQQAVNRIQSFEETREVIDAARASGFASVSVDLIYGLPRQNPFNFAATLEKVLDLRPDRIALYSYAHLPSRFTPQRRIVEAELPTPEAKLVLLGLAIRRLAHAGYQYIGMDHFALPDDELARAQAGGRLHRNFQGYSTHADLDLLAFGVSGISKLGRHYAQNAKTLDGYGAALAEGRLPIERGITLDADDLLRRDAIQRLMCDFSLDLDQLAARHGVADAEACFADDLKRLRPLAQAGLIEIDGPRLQVTPRGRLLVRVIAMQFDRRLHDAAAQLQAPRYSRVI
ncbi:MAG: oxygen-independent coproporphyrinogen III oxidase [Betaproteobacteria bacterium]|nr:oxygen-independent coproporphyrinogen III oxidase [Betaproteobacteria bacterium]